MDRNSALNGALVADTAAMGLHWMYDQEQIGAIAKTGDVLFRQPDENAYRNKKGYFAHAARRAGELSHYGEATALFADFVRREGAFCTKGYRQAFLSTFGPGGQYVGYIDWPTRALVSRLLNEGDDIDDASGCDDDQLPALACVPGLFATHQTPAVVTAAVKVSSTNDTAISGALTLLSCLEHTAAGAPLSDALLRATSEAVPELQSLLQEALNLTTENPLEAANHFGLPSHIPQGMPVAWYLLANAKDFESAVRDNVLCGGDSCGRAIAIGSIAGLAFGVPDTLINRTAHRLY